jgi:DNA-binding transcriptional MerR regulator
MIDERIPRTRREPEDETPIVDDEDIPAETDDPIPAKVPTAPSRASRPGLSRAPASPIHADKPVFTLSVAADLLGMHPRTLRIYEEERLVIPFRTDTQRRRYSQIDIKRFQFIQHLTQRLHVNLAGVRIILEMLEELQKQGVDFTPRLYEMADDESPPSVEEP